MSGKTPSPSNHSKSVTRPKTKATPTKSVKNKSLPSTKISSRYMKATASKSGVTVSQEKRTPEKIGSGSKACSTPTNDEVTISDLTLDASCISTVKSNTNLLEETVRRPPVMKLKSSTAAKPTRGNQNVRGSVNKTMMPPRLSGTARKSPLRGNNFKSAMKQVRREVEILESDPDEITDDMMETAYFRYIQAKFIAMKSREAKKQVEEDCRNQILQAFFMTEELRMEVQKREMQAVLEESLISMRKSLTTVEERIVPVLQALKPVKVDLGSVASSLDGIKDNLVVQGINLGDQKEAVKEVENLERMFSKFNEDMMAYKDIAKADGDRLENISRSFKELSEDYSNIVKLTENVKKLLKETESLAVQEASLAISLRDIGISIEE